MCVNSNILCWLKIFVRKRIENVCNIGQISENTSFFCTIKLSCYIPNAKYNEYENILISVTESYELFNLFRDLRLVFIYLISYPKTIQQGSQQVENLGFNLIILPRI